MSIEGHEDKMIEVLKAIKDTREALEEVSKDSKSVYQVTRHGDITAGEFKQVLTSRLARLQAEAHNLGITGPAAKHSARGQAIATVHANNARQPA